MDKSHGYKNISSSAQAGISYLCCLTFLGHLSSKDLIRSHKISEVRSPLLTYDGCEASRWALLAESLRWAARGHDFLRTFAAQVHGVDLPKAQTPRLATGSDTLSYVSVMLNHANMLRLAVVLFTSLQRSLATCDMWQCHPK